VRVALLDNQLFEYRLPFLMALQERVERLRVFVPGLGFDLTESKLRATGLDICQLRSVSVNRTLRYPHGISEASKLDLPWNILHALSHFKPDAVICGEMGLRSLQAAAFRQVNANCRLVIWARVSQHTEAGRGSARKLIRKALVRRIDSIVTNGQSGREYLAGLGADPMCVHVIHQASAIDPLPHSPGGKDQLRLLFVGRLVTLKGLHLLLPVLSRHAPGTWTLTVVGDGPEYGTLQALVNQWNLPVHFTGFLPRGELPRLFAGHDVLVFPTLKDEWGLVVGEALRAGLPVLGSVYSEAVCEIVEDGVNGWRMRPDNEESIHTAVSRAFAATPAELHQFGELARDSARDLTPEAMAEQFIGVLHSARDRAHSLASPPLPAVPGRRVIEGVHHPHSNRTLSELCEYSCCLSVIPEGLPLVVRSLYVVPCAL
jgi:glycosyltransferase involved in cell wall biosynthesis